MDSELRIGTRVLNYSRYGHSGGVPVLSLGGSPSTRWKRPEVVAAIADAGLDVVFPDRPGYGGSTRQPGRTVAAAAADAAALADHLGWSAFAVTGGSGGGPHALACAALLSDRVTRCAVVGGIAPPLTDGPQPTQADEDADPRRNETSWLAAHEPASLRPLFEQSAAHIMSAVEAGGPEFPPDPGTPPGPPARDDAEAMARLTATFVTSHDGWYDDLVAFARPWGFDFADVAVPVRLWYGSADERSRRYAELLAGELSAERVEYAGGHIPPAPAYREVLGWLSR
ncbi:alpha/beta hydrolase [Kribbella sandramycini]|uniref:Alpha/beta hydrolase n=1 Tax=Kribbella sandramycini TaxID=60450 RepID=A0A7Y4L765_9ACTN|nr:alpha/beta hydrolase [Kribbella sandramycini]MBB6568871.1 pimeloyl-ACP methyl ester carboxylesterase [Kribbella sandramycini]NOL45639.1 alpha/beta hydrolase [Kribbella sandramycini]